ncbi:MAG: DegV family protein [Ruminococcaceae bacterium]|nr:DegV family protein [Oscillospiraceae bacterium]
MKKVKILADSCSDLTGELLEKYDIDYAKMRYTYNGVEKEAKLTWSEDEIHELYNVMRDGIRVTTAQVPADEYTRLFTKYVAEGYDIVYIGCSSKQSSSINTSCVVAEQFMKENEGSNIICIDSLNACVPFGALVIEAAKMAQDGKSAEEIRDAILPMRKKINQFCTVHSLKTMYKAGRVKGATAFFGNLLGVKPILISDADGVQTPLKKVKGRKTSFEEIVNLLKEAIENPEEQTVYLAHADCSKEEVEELKAMVKAAIPCKDIYVSYIGPIIGGTIGPDAIALAAFGKEVTYRVGEE